MATAQLRNPNAEPDADAMHLIAKRLGIALPAVNGSASKLIQPLRSAFEKRLEGVAEDDRIECAACGEETDDDPRINICPFCGDEGEGEGEAEAKAIDGEEIDEGRDVEEAKPVNLAAVREKKKKKDKVATKPKSLEEDYREQCAIIEREKKVMVGSGYDLGVALRKVHEGELWRAANLKSFGAFVKEQKISRAFAYKLMHLVAEYSREDFVEIGQTKLMVISDAPEEVKGELEDAAKRGASKRDLHRIAGKRKPQAAAKPKEEDEEKQITLLAKVGGRPKTYEWHDRETRKPVKAWTAESYGEVRISDDVSLLLALKTEGKKIVGFTAAFKRAE